MYANGRGGTANNIEAIKWYRLAATQGNSRAQSNLGLLYDEGNIVPQDYLEAAKWYRLAAANDNSVAQVNLGVMYAEGKGVYRDYVRAYMWFSIAKGSRNASALQGLDYMAGRMTKKQISEAQAMASDCLKSRFIRCD